MSEDECNVIFTRKANKCPKIVWFDEEGGESSGGMIGVAYWGKFVTMSKLRNELCRRMLVKSYKVNEQSVSSVYLEGKCRYQRFSVVEFVVECG